jgi:hypothetical protein
MIRRPRKAAKSIGRVATNDRYDELQNHYADRLSVL